jgi:hypothetical protein
MSDLINRLNELADLMEKTKDAAKQGYKEKTLYNMAADIGMLKGIIDNLVQANEAPKQPESEALALNSVKPCLKLECLDILMPTEVNDNEFKIHLPDSYTYFNKEEAKQIADFIYQHLNKG